MTQYDDDTAVDCKFFWSGYGVYVNIRLYRWRKGALV